MTTAPTLSDRVRAARLAAGMSQPEAALAAGIGLTALRNIEQGITDDPRLSTVRHLERALGVSLIHATDVPTPDAPRVLHPETETSPSPTAA